MTPLISILLPTIRPDLFQVRMQEYARLDLPEPCELITVSDRPEVDITPTHQLLTLRLFHQERSGTVAAMNLAFEKAEGKYIFATNDEVELESNVFTVLINAAESGGEDGIYAVSQTPYCSNDYYDIYFAPCPFGRRGFFQKLNGGNYLFDPVYHCFYADPDLAVRAHAQGITVTKAPHARTHHRRCVRDGDGHSFNWHTYYQKDRDTFSTRWAHLGPPQIDPSLRS